MNPSCSKTRPGLLRLVLLAASTGCLLGADLLGAAEPPLKTEAKPLVDLTGQPVTIACLGDSVTGVYYHTGGQRAYPEMLEIAIATAAPTANVKVINAGISGHSTTEGLTRLETDVLAHHPQLVTISFGLNDMVRVDEEQFRKNLNTLISRCREAKSSVVLCTPNSVISTSVRPIEKLRRYCEIIRLAGQAAQVPVCDQFAAGEAQRAQDAWAWRLTLSDEIHPNMDGHKRMAEELCRTITGSSVSLAATPPPPHPLAKTLARLQAGQPVKVIAMPPFDTLVEPALKRHCPTAVIEVTTWVTADKSLQQLEAVAKETVRALQPNLVVLAIPRSATAETDEEFVRSYSWVMNWSLSFGHTEWDCLVVHPAVAAAETAPRDELVRQLVRAQDLHLIDREKSDESSAAELFSKWVEANSPAP